MYNVQKKEGMKTQEDYSAADRGKERLKDYFTSVA